MEHMEFKENQIAAAYVADGLDENTQEAFELHMMRCPDCVEDVEVWRAIKLEMPAQTKRYGTVARQRGIHSFAIRRTAMICLAAILLGAVVGWHSWDVHGTDLDVAHIVMFSLPAVTRSTDECAIVPLAADTRVVFVPIELHVPGSIVARGSEKGALPAGQSSSRTQPDGTQLLKIDAQLLIGRAVHLYAQHANGSENPIGCLTGSIVQTER